MMKISDENHVYSAFAALIHYGDTTNRGHFVMKVRNHNTNIWHNFSDTTLDKSAAVEGGKNESNNVYMVMYIRKSKLDSYSCDDIQKCKHPSEKSLQAFVKEEDLARRKKEHSTFTKYHRLITEMLSSPKDGQILEFEFFSNKWVKDFMGTFNNLSLSVPVDNDDIICPHGKVVPAKSNGSAPYRVLPPGISNEIYLALGGGPRLVVKNNLCQDCVRFILKKKGKTETVQPMEIDTKETVPTEQKENLISSSTSSCCEQNEPKTENPASFSSFPINPNQYFVNVIESAGDGKKPKSYKREIELMVEGTKTLQQLKNLIGQQLNLNCNHINVMFNGTQLENPEQSLAEYEIGSNDSINIWTSA